MYQFKWKSTSIEVHFLFVCVVTLVFLLDQQGTAPLALTVAVMHEMGHLLALTLLGHPPRCLSFHLFGVRLAQSRRLLPPHQEAIILVAGSGVNLLTAAVVLLALPPSPTRVLFASMHLAIGILNLLPVRGLDGGDLLELALTQRFPLWRGERILALIQWGFLLLFTGFIVFYCWQGGITLTQLPLTLLLILTYLWLSLLRS